MSNSAFPPRPSPSPSPTANPRPEGDPRLVGVWDQFYAYCFAIINECPGVRRLSFADREDCVQDVMTEIVRRFGAPRTEAPPPHLDSWIRAVSRNKAADLVRRRTRKPEVFFDDGSGDAVLDDPPPGEGGPGHREYISLVWEALLSLDHEVSATSYLVFYLRNIENWDVPEIAELFQMTPEQARARCHRVRKKFESILKERGA
jgi:RNA polymerase sigma factor (sigma-70 family)